MTVFSLCKSYLDILNSLQITLSYKYRTKVALKIRRKTRNWRKTKFPEAFHHFVPELEQIVKVCF